MKGRLIIDSLRKKYNLSSNEELARKLNCSPKMIDDWNKSLKVTPRQIAGLVDMAQKSALNASIRPLVEFYPIQKTPAGKKFNIFTTTAHGKPHPYTSGLRKELEDCKGVYIFFDSRGQAIYVGKTAKQTLWQEINGAFNRPREIQKIRRVKHPSRKQAYQTSLEKQRHIDEFSVPLHELAAYFSVYDITPNMISNIEALLVRSFANDILNIRMERFPAYLKKSLQF